MFARGSANATQGSVHWQPMKSLWVSAMTAIALIGGPLFFSWGAFVLFLITTGTVICLGHSIGMHRLLIHRSFACSRALERMLVAIGTLAGMAGPIGMIRQHDLRDWAQRQNVCHAFLAHQSGFWRDGWWQLHCELRLADPPELVLEPRVRDDPWLAFLERTWMVQQLPWALLFWACGGLSWVVWGVAARVAVLVTGHWLIGYFAHNRGPRRWHVAGAAVQGHNVPYCGLITMGESWHNNHHAFPGSARLGLLPGEVDPGWWVLRAFAAFGLIWDVTTPETLPARPNLRPAGPDVR